MDKKQQLLLIVGAGSIGRRHYINLKNLGYLNLCFVRSGRENDKPQQAFLDKYKPNVVYDIKEGLDKKPLAVIVTNPTLFHLDIAMKAFEAGCHVFIEKPISHSTEGINKLIALAKKKERILYVGYHFRHHPQIKSIKKYLDGEKLGKLYYARFTTGEYLPNWHPWEDYRKGYAAQKNLGGGALLTQSHDFDCAIWMFGKMKKLSSHITTSGLLDINVDDNDEITASFEKCPLVAFHLDYLMQPDLKRYEFFGTKGRIEWNYQDDDLAIFLSNGIIKHIRIPKKFQRNKMYIAEMKEFMDCIKNNKTPSSDGLAGLVVLELIKSAWKNNS